MSNNQKQSQQEVDAINKFLKRKMYPCYDCNGTGKTFTALHGDPNLGYSATGVCGSCRGSGKEKIQVQ